MLINAALRIVLMAHAYCTVPQAVLSEVRSPTARGAHTFVSSLALPPCAAGGSCCTWRACAHTASAGTRCFECTPVRKPALFTKRHIATAWSSKACESRGEEAVALCLGSFACAHYLHGDEWAALAPISFSPIDLLAPAAPSQRVRARMFVTDRKSVV